MLNRPGKVTPMIFSAVLAAAGLSALAFPEPDIVSKSWQLDVTYQHPRVIAIKGIDGRTHWYWYLTYKVVNHTGQERFFMPEVTIATDRGDIITAGVNVPASVFTAIREKLDNPLLENPIDVVDKILQGPDMARESVAIWPAFDHDVDRMDVFFTGLSGETKVVTHPLTGEPIPLRKTLMLQYDTPGTGTHPQDQALLLRDETWIMR